jgi:integrase
VELNGRIIDGPPKSKAGRRVVGIPEAIAVELRRHMRKWSQRGADGRVFTSATGGPLRRSNFAQRQWRPALRKVGLEGLHFHDLRHAGASWVAETGVGLRDLMEHLGHSTPAAALVYQHAARDRAQRIAERLTERTREADGARMGHAGPRARRQGTPPERQNRR